MPRWATLAGPHRAELQAALFHARQRRLGRLQRPSWLPANALTHYDFVNGNYYANGREQAFADMFRTELGAHWGAQYVIDPNDVVADEGWHSNLGATGNDFAVMSFAAMKGWWEPGTVTEYSAVVEVDSTGADVNDNYTNFRLATGNSENYGPSWRFNDWRGKYSGATTYGPDFSGYDSSGITGPYYEFPPTLAAGTRKMGITVIGSTRQGSFVADGGTVQTADLSADLTALEIDDMNVAYLRNFHSDSWDQVVKTVTIYPPMSDSALQALTGA